MAVSGKLDDAPVKFPDFWIYEFAAMALQLGVGVFLINPHEATVPRDLGRQNGGEPAFDSRRSSFPRHSFLATAARTLLPLAV